MSDWTVGVVSPKGYDHSATFNDVAFALAGAFTDLGHRVALCTLSETGADTQIYPSQQIILGANLMPHYAVTGWSQNAIILNLEQANSYWMGPKYLALLRQHEVWDYSERNIEWLAGQGIHARLCRVGYHRTLTRIEPTEDENIDVLFYGSNTERRTEIIREMCKLGINVQCLFGCYGPERDRYIAQSKIILNLHAYTGSPLEIVRLQLLFANRKCVLTETCAPDDAEWQTYRGCMAEGTNAAHLASTAKMLLEDQSLRFQLGKLGFEALKARPQADFLRPLLQPEGVPL